MPEANSSAGDRPAAGSVLTPGQLNRATLARQFLLVRAPLPVPEAVRHLVGLQAQHPAGPYLALWNRLARFDPAALDIAFATNAVIRATLLRVTLHVAHADDYVALHEAMEPSLRDARIDGQLFATGFTREDVETHLPGLLAEAATVRPSAALATWLAEATGNVATPDAWSRLRHYAPVWHAPGDAPWTFGPRASFVASPTVPRRNDPDAAAAGLVTLTRRYLAAYGPATVADIAQFAYVRQWRVKAAIASLGDELVTFTSPAGKPLYDLPGAPLPDAATPAPPRLLGMWDNVLLAYHDRSRLMPPDYRRVVVRQNGDYLPALLVDGRVAGIWRQTSAGIEATAFHELSEDDWHGLATEAAALLAMLSPRDAAVYGRYDHWWPRLPPGDTRLIASTQPPMPADGRGSIADRG